MFGDVLGRGARICSRRDKIVHRHVEELHFRVGYFLGLDWVAGPKCGRLPTGNDRRISRGVSPFVFVQALKQRG